MKKTKNKRIIFFSHHPKYDAAVRFRLVQYFDYLRSKGLKIWHRPFVTNYLYFIKNDNGLIKVVIKFLIFVYCSFRRIIDIYYIVFSNVVLIHREMHPLGLPLLEQGCKIIKKRIVFDFDDAIYLKSNYPQKWRNIFRDGKKTEKIIRISDAVIVGNSFLADYSKKYNKNVYEIPTVLDIGRCPVKLHLDSRKLVIGWIGSWGTTQYINRIRKVLIQLYKEKQYLFKIIGAKNIFNIKIPEIEVDYKIWSLENETKDIYDIDIGIMPIDFDEWSKGKSGLKIIQFFSFGIPVVASNIGINRQVIEHGKDGFLAKTNEDWLKYLGILLKDFKLRCEFGSNARNKVRKKYSKKVFQEIIYNILLQ